MTTPQNLTVTQLNSILVPSFLQGLTLSQQYAALEGSGTEVVNFRRQSLELYIQTHKAYRAKQRGSCWNNYSVPWTIPSGFLVISYCALANYYYPLLKINSSSSGFALLFNKIKEFEVNSRKCCPKGKHGGL